MCDFSVTNFKRIAAGIMGIVMLVIVLLFSFYVAEEADHDCTGDDCPICACMQQCESVLHQVGDGTVQVSVAAPVVFLFLFVLFSVRGIAQETLVSRKVRLND